MLAPAFSSAWKRLASQPLNPELVQTQDYKLVVEYLVCKQLNRMYGKRPKQSTKLIIAEDNEAVIKTINK